MSCVNLKCSNDSLKSMHRVVVNIDGDMACCKKCEIEYKKQRDNFFNVIVHDEKKCKEWLLGNE